MIQLAVFFGILGVVARTVYVVGLSDRLRSGSPTLAVAAKYFGILGGIGHGLVALTFYVGLPMIAAMAATDPGAAANTWNAQNVATSGYQLLGNLLLGAMLLSAGAAGMTQRSLPKAVAWIGAAGGAVTIMGVLAAGTALRSVGFMLFLPAILLAVAFDLGAGTVLYRRAGGP
jgi:hypothetical protein